MKGKLWHVCGVEIRSGIGTSMADDCGQKRRQYLPSLNTEASPLENIMQ